MASNAIQRRNADEQSDDNDSTNREYCIICSEDTDSSRYSFVVSLTIYDTYINLAG